MATTPPRHNASLLLLPQSTPVKAVISLLLPFTTTQKYCVESYTALAQEIKQYIVGPIPPEEFLQTFFPLDNISVSWDPFEVGCYDATVNATTERSSYEPFVSHLKGRPHPPSRL